MTTSKILSVAVAIAAITAAHAQTQKPPTGTGDPSAASTPHQRETTGAKSAESTPGTSPEASAASSPHQRSAAMDAQDPQMRMAHQDGMVPEKFTKSAALDGMTEVELGQLALARSQDAKIRKFAQQMVTDHGKANAELAKLAKSKGMQVPTKLDAEHQAMVQELSAKNGTAFDAAYAEHMMKAHAKAVALFDGASMGNDAELAGFAKKTLPTLKEHQEMAEALPSKRTAEAGAPTSR